MCNRRLKSWGIIWLSLNNLKLAFAFPCLLHLFHNSYHDEVFLQLCIKNWCNNQDTCSSIILNMIIVHGWMVIEHELLSLTSHACSLQHTLCCNSENFPGKPLTLQLNRISPDGFCVTWNSKDLKFITRFITYFTRLIIKSYNKWLHYTHCWSVPGWRWNSPSTGFLCISPWTWKFGTSIVITYSFPFLQLPPTEPTENNQTATTEMKSQFQKFSSNCSAQTSQYKLCGNQSHSEWGWLHAICSLSQIIWTIIKGLPTDWFSIRDSEYPYSVLQLLQLKS